MRPIEKIYWIRLGLGVVAALVCTGYVAASGQIEAPKVDPSNPSAYLPLDSSVFFMSTSIALLIYLLSYYLIKSKFEALLETSIRAKMSTGDTEKKPALDELGLQRKVRTKLVMTGIGIYFIAWLVLFVMLYTILAGPPAV
jgi:hypothetical protein